MRALDFDYRVRGDHHIFTRSDIPDIINVQPNGSMAKVYQVRQVRQLILRFQMGDSVHE
jgi:hypothetical protein